MCADCSGGQGRLGETGDHHRSGQAQPPQSVADLRGRSVPGALVTTVTPNPALDRTLRVDELTFGGIARVQTVQEDPGGKGINVSRILRAFGCRTAALGFLGGGTGRRLVEALAGGSIEADFIEIQGESRVNLTCLQHDAGRTARRPRAVRDVRCSTASVPRRGPPASSARLRHLRLSCGARRTRSAGSLLADYRDCPTWNSA
jgi:hypothetical protein